MSHAIVPALSGYWQEAIRACAGTRLSARPELPINTGMGQQEGNHEATGPGESAQGSEGHSLTCCLDELLRALDLHRLCFLFFAEAHRVNPRFVGGETVKKPKRFGEIRKKGVDDRGEFLLRYRDEIGQFAEATINDFGYGKGQKPIEPYDEETWGEVKGGSYPRWTVYRQDIGWLQKTSDKVVEACARLGQAESSNGDSQLAKDTLQAVWPHGTAKWYAARSIPWDYLEGIDTIITLVTEAIVKVKDIKTQVNRRDAKGADGPRFASLPIPQGPTDVNTQSMKWDVFISHASEDKEAFVRPLAEALRKENIRVWYDEFTLTVGDSLRRLIDHGLASSRYGIVVISPSFLAKEWPQKELDGLAAQEVDGRKVILPVWHNVDAETLRRCSPLLADRVATSTAKGVQAVVADLMKAMR